MQDIVDPYLELQQLRRRRWVIFSAALVAGVLFATYGARPLYDAVKGWRARRLAAAAETAMAAGHLQEAASSAAAAYHLKPDEPQALRIAGRIHGRTGRPAEAIRFWKGLVATGASTSADRLAYAQDLLMSGAIAEAGQEIEELRRGRPDDAVLLRLASRWALAEGDSTAALEMVSKAQRLEPSSPEGMLLMGVIQIASEADAQREAGIQRLVELGREASREGLQALLRLAVEPNLPAATGEQVVDLLKKHPGATEEHRLAAMGLELTLHPEKSSALLDDAAGRYAGADPAVKRAFAIWLNAHGHHERTLALMPFEEAFGRKDHLLVYLDAVAGLKQWREVKRILEMEKLPLGEAYREVFLAQAEKEIGSATGAAKHWSRAVIAAGASADELLWIGNHAEKLGLIDQAERAYGSLSKIATGARLAYEGLLRVGRKRFDCAMIMGTLRKMHERWPKDGTVRNDLSYIGLLQVRAFWVSLCLSGMNYHFLPLAVGQARIVEDSFRAASRGVTDAPGNMGYRTTLALAALRKNDPLLALGVYQGLKVRWERFPAGQRAVYAAVLGLSGKSDEARAEARAVRWDELLLEERELIQQWRAP